MSLGEPRCPNCGRGAGYDGHPIQGGPTYLDQVRYAWECAENMRGWAMRSEENLRMLRDQKALLIQAAREACLAWTAPGCNQREKDAMAELARLVEVPI